MGRAYSLLPLPNPRTKMLNLQAAIKCYQIALQAYTNKQMYDKLAQTHYALGDAYRAMPESDDGKRTHLEVIMALYETAWFYSSKSGNRKARLDSSQRSGWVYSTFADYTLSTEEKKAYLRKALAAYNIANNYCERNDLLVQAEIQYYLGLVHSKLDQPLEALNCYDVALMICGKNELCPDIYADILYAKGSAALILFKRQQSSDNFNDAEASFKKAASAYQQLSRPDEIIKAQNGLQALYDYKMQNQR